MFLKEKCINCIERKRCKDSYVSWVFFAIGLVATVAIRIVTVLMHFNPLYGKLAWYIGVGGFFLFFAYKFKINQNRARVITERNLIEKFEKQTQLNKEENEFMSAIMCSLISRKERMNYFFIFALSAVSLLVAIYFDFMK